MVAPCLESSIPSIEILQKLEAMPRYTHGQLDIKFPNGFAEVRVLYACYTADVADWNRGLGFCFECTSIGEALGDAGYALSCSSAWTDRHR